ncbi:MAG TPA: helix-turn-helix domain-containing protein [Salinarimonas sp.]|nr:helix-turn-helix domain-containing protein [Salinarimonas sp.]
MTATNHLGPTQARVLMFILRHARANGGRVPTIRGICEGVGLQSTSTAHHHIRTLAAAGLLAPRPDRTPCYEVVTDGCYCLACGNALPLEGSAS